MSSETAKEEPQVGCNLTRQEGKVLEDYARKHELSRPNLCRLLIVRELLLKRLPALSERYAGSGSRKNAARVTVRISDQAKAEFDEHLRNIRIGSDDAAAMLFRAEIVECWLEHAVSQEGNRS